MGINKWEEIKPGRIAWKKYAIVTLSGGSSHNYVAYNDGSVIGFGNVLKDIKKICRECAEDAK